MEINRKKTEAYIYSMMSKIDPSGKNTERYKKLFLSFSDKQFDTFMKQLATGEMQLYVVRPNLTKQPSLKDLFDLSDELGIETFARIYRTDPTTGKRYLSPTPNLILQLPIRRMVQFVAEKRSVPDNDRDVDALTGQVTGNSRAAGITGPEIHALENKGLDPIVKELVAVRGGNIEARAEIKQQMEDYGECKMSDIETNNASRTAKTMEALLIGMHLDNNYSEI